ncbi:hypothetical protein JZU48_00295 [bacterium]|jgi:hypothetical protein|nr:hypothetical protein [bacterium]
MTTPLPPNPLMIAVRMRIHADSLSAVAADMSQITADPWPHHAAELAGAVVLLRDWADAITEEAAL